MAKKKKQNKKPIKEEEKKRDSYLSLDIKRRIWGIVMMALALIVILAFFDLSGLAGKVLTKSFFFTFGKGAFLIPFWLVLAGLIFFNFSSSKNFLKINRAPYLPTILGIFLLILGMSGILGTLGQENREGGYLGYVATWPFLRVFSFWPTLIIYSTFILVAILIIRHLFKEEEESKKELGSEIKGSKSPIIQLFRKVTHPEFKIKEIKDARAKTKEIAQLKETTPTFKSKKVGNLL